MLYITQMQKYPKTLSNNLLSSQVLSLKQDTKSKTNAQ